MRRQALALAAALLVCPAPAAALEQPSGAPIPSDMGCNGGQPTGLAAVFACQCLTPGVCNIGGVCPSPGMCPSGENATCETTLAHEFNDNTCIPSKLTGLDPRADASITPERFQPTCALTFTVVSRGTAIFGDVFGWYNVTGDKPGLEDLHPMLGCDDAAGAAVVLDLQADPAYAGGEIGFFLATPERSGACADGDCCASLDRVAAGDGHVYYSERGYNPDAAGPDSYIHLLVFDSRIVDRKFYFAWEDIFGGSNNDFTDLVTSVEGVECSGGGAACDTGSPGVCAYGVSACENNQLRCRPLYDASTELCNALDDDCDGAIDDGAACPGADEVCDGGRCLPNCEIVHEFDCPATTVCDAATGRCHDPDCAGVTCPPDEACRAGACTAPCDGIACPVGQTCRFGACIDPCADVSCGNGEACVEGLCFPGCAQCNGVQCTDGLACAASGECVDPSCPEGCPPGSYCDDGRCLDACGDALCPPGTECVDGACTPPGDGADDGGGADGGGCLCARGQGHAPAEGLLVLLLWRRPSRRRRGG